LARLTGLRLEGDENFRMGNRLARDSRGWVLFAFVALVAAGCSHGRTKEDFIPPVPQAQATLEAGLRAWQGGIPDGQVPNTSPGLILSDTLRRPGQKLEKFEILGEAPGDWPRCFAVRVVLSNPREELTARYVVFGIDPLTVCRHEDFEMLEHWDHAMMVERAKAGQAAVKEPHVRQPTNSGTP
jgi:hypothetical protein